jgi:hypothetical protein
MAEDVAALAIDRVTLLAGIALDGSLGIPSLGGALHEITGIGTLKEKEVHRYLMGLTLADRPPWLRSHRESHVAGQ